MRRFEVLFGVVFLIFADRCLSFVRKIRKACFL